MEHFKTTEEFELAAAKTYANFYNILGSRPTKLWTGGGIHYIQPQQVPILEKLDNFSKFDEVSRKFLEFEEQLLTDGLADQTHCRATSFNNCMLRVPGTINFSCIKEKDTEIPYDARVRIVQKWDGNMPVIGKLMLMRYRNWLQFKAINDIREQKIMENQRYCYGRAMEEINLRNYGYIDRLFDKPISNFRKLCIWKIFVPYYINIKKLSIVETSEKVRSWLDRCNEISRLDFKPDLKIKYVIKKVGSFLPPTQYRLESDNKPFYERLKTEGVI
jgi:hypothetical protein